MSLFSANGLTKVYSSGDANTVAVNGVSFSIDAGEYVVLGGPSGCGKSTLLKLIGLMEPPTQGTISYDGLQVQGMSEDDRARVRGLTLGFVFQAFHLIPELTIRENIALPLQYHRQMNKAQQNEAIEEACRRVGITNRLSFFPDELSGGQQQRAAIARAIVGNPQLLLADEPTGNLDSKNSDQVMALLADLNKQGTSICLVTHDPRYLTAGRRTLHMHDGIITRDEVR